MTNTYFGAGRDTKDEIIEETKSGVLTLKWISGMEDPVGGSFQAVTQSGSRIHKGEVGERVRGMTLTGNALSILKSVDRVSKETALDGGSCGKGEEDYVPVAAGGPYMRCKIVVGGGGRGRARPRPGCGATRAVRGRRRGGSVRDRLHLAIRLHRRRRPEGRRGSERDGPRGPSSPGAGRRGPGADPRFALG